MEPRQGAPAAREGGTIDRDEVERFARQAHAWWDENGPFRPLHRLNPARLRFIRARLQQHFAREHADELAPFTGLRLLDIGCGGGLVSEPMARLGFAVHGIDADANALAVARAHAEETGLVIEYRADSVEELAARGATYDAVLALEVAEHAADAALFLATAAALVAPGGALVASTINRTARAFVTTVVGAEYVLRWLPRGTHQWRKFLRPSEMAGHLRHAGMNVAAIEGLNFHPLSGDWALGRDLGVNYLLIARKPK
ncbi:MAG TPA: bifunctional 2-polyprenyl-6-hydroxyphenol methylase/3-demethylubiquinol 3-O-methyltransferase UbiG [Stellaceae bacterium]|nr:bifunctional 2-polyprenyl-6-hydroxyphenol methylase/3-demethylubiquinol 3-O-methyltransferase UbiG [Stellaceae bacterium]